MAVQNLDGTDLLLSVGGVSIGCATKIDVKVSTATSSAACRATGKWKESTSGVHSWTATTDGLYRIATGADIPTNMTVATLLALQVAGTPVQLSFGSSKSGDETISGNALITDIGMSGPDTGSATFSVSFEGTGPLTFTPVP